MSILPAYFTTTNLNTKKVTPKRNTKHEEFIKKMTKGMRKDTKLLNKQFRDQYREDMKVTPKYESLGTFGEADSCAKKDIMTNLHKESPEVQKQILEKAARTAPGWNKSGYMYITDGMDPKTLGKKV